MQENKTAPRHIFLNNTWFVALVLPIWLLAAENTISTAVTALMLQLTTSTFLCQLLTYLTGVAAALALIPLAKSLYKENCTFGFTRKGLKESLLFVWPVALFFLLNVANLFIYQVPLVNTPQKVIITLVSGFRPGLVEEILFRGLLISLLMKIGRNRSNRILHALIWSSLSFGLVHAANMGTLKPIEVLFQIVYAGAIGISLGAVYLRTRNLWGPMIVHALVDIAAFMPAAAISMMPNEYYMAPILSAIAISGGLYLVRPSKWAEVEALWDKDWQFGHRPSGKKTLVLALVITLVLILAAGTVQGVAYMRGYTAEDLLAMSNPYLADSGDSQPSQELSPEIPQDLAEELLRQTGSLPGEGDQTVETLP